MKTILVPTDYSTTAGNAIDYAVEIAKLAKSKLILFNVFNLPVISPETSIAVTVDEMERNALGELKKIKDNLHQQHGEELIIEYDCACTNTVIEAILLFTKQNKVDLIVMGMEGAGYLIEKIIGSTTTSVIREATCPVLAIDKKVKYSSIKKIALACDYTEMNHKLALSSLKEIINLFQSQLYIINVVNEPVMVSNPEREISTTKLEQLLAGFSYSSYQINNENVIEGINDFVSEKSIDMVVMIPHKHSALERIFTEPYTKQMAFHSKVPLLTIKE